MIWRGVEMVLLILPNATILTRWHVPYILSNFVESRTVHVRIDLFSVYISGIWVGLQAVINNQDVESFISSVLSGGVPDSASAPISTGRR